MKFFDWRIFLNHEGMSVSLKLLCMWSAGMGWKPYEAEMCFNWLELWIRLELVRGIAVMPSEFLVSAMETTERQGESRTQKEERTWSCGEGKGREGWLWLLPSWYRSCSLLATGRSLAGDMQGKGFISLSFCCLGVVACKVAARCMARGKQGPICPSRTLKETGWERCSRLSWSCLFELELIIHFE